MLFPQQDNSDKKAVRFTNQLLQAVQNKGKLYRRINKKLWIREMSKLLEEVGPKRITAALKFYTDKIGTPYIPQAFSASAFRKKFQAIEAATSRNNPEIKKVVITDTARRVQIAAGDLLWPNSEKKDELEFIQASIDNYSAALLCLDESILSCKDFDTAGVLQYARSILNPDPDLYVQDFWLPAVHRIAWNWSKWNTKLLRWVWHPDAKPFVSEVRGLLTQWDGSEKNWEIVRKSLTK